MELTHLDSEASISLNSFMKIVIHESILLFLLIFRFRSNIICPKVRQILITDGPYKQNLLYCYFYIHFLLKVKSRNFVCFIEVHALSLIYRRQFNWILKAKKKLMEKWHKISFEILYFIIWHFIYRGIHSYRVRV